GNRAGEMYSGFDGAIIEQNYKYNEFVSNKALLLEVGNNKNTIEEANACGRYFAEVLADVIEEENR
ncbi:MAG: stage II sporulation protein P, partial [Firmicutes bacterium]|nr:stage II sporulation protein P [Bacillota bacterium]